MEQNKINRINELAKKSKTTGLTSEEKAEQKLLRDEYISSFRANLKSTLDQIVIVNKDGSRKNFRNDH